MSKRPGMFASGHHLVDSLSVLISIGVYLVRVDMRSPVIKKKQSRQRRHRFRSSPRCVEKLFRIDKQFIGGSLLVIRYSGRSGFVPPARLFQNLLSLNGGISPGPVLSTQKMISTSPWFRWIKIARPASRRLRLRCFSPSAQPLIRNNR